MTRSEEISYLKENGVPGEEFSVDPAALIEVLRSIRDGSSVDLVMAKYYSSPIILLQVGIKLLNQFLQANLTGPNLRSPLIDAAMDNAYNCDHLLDVDGESVYPGCLHRELLASALAIFEALSTHSDLVSVGVWRARSVFVRQRALLDSNDRGQGNSPSLMEVCLNEYCEALGKHGYLPSELVLETLAHLPKSGLAKPRSRMVLPEADSLDVDLKAELILEFLVRLAYYGKTQLIPAILKYTTGLLGISIELTGVEGIRRQYQSEAFAQLACRVTREREQETTESSLPTVPAPKALTLVELDATTDMLEDVKYSGSDDSNTDLTSKLSAIEQCCLIVEGLRCFYSGSSRDELNLESVHAIAMRVISICSDAPPSWIAFSMCLLFRSRAEFFRNNTRGRACFQTDALVDQFKDSEPVPAIRLRHIHTTGYPSQWELQRENGVRMMEVGMVMTACEMFKKLEMWPLALDCLAVAGKKQEALDLLDSLEPLTARLLVSKGDMTGEQRYYEQAWEMSGHKSARAMRALGRLKLRESDLEAAAECFEKSLEINPLFDEIWFNLGSIYLRLDAREEGKGFKEKAIQAFVRCVNVNPEHVQAWVNLSAAYADAGNEFVQEAQRAAGEAVKLAPEAWQFWENYTLISARAEDWQNVLRGEQKLSLSLNRDDHPDIHIIRLLVSKVAVSSPLRTRVLSFLEDLVLKNKQNLETLKILSAMYSEFNRPEEAFKTLTCELKEILGLVGTVGEVSSKYTAQELTDETIICLGAIADMLDGPELRTVSGITAGLVLTARSVPRRIAGMAGGQELPQLKALCERIQQTVNQWSTIPE
jgi:tetratricopeptide (TPR) repeat protein